MLVCFPSHVYIYISSFICFKEIASEYTTNKHEFERKALALVKKHGLPRS
jgi:hypothetical protein